jgi:hypothetical protein
MIDRMASWIDRLLEEFGRNIVQNGWADPWTWFPPMVGRDDPGRGTNGSGCDKGPPVGDRPRAGQELTASSSR